MYQDAYQAGVCPWTGLVMLNRQSALQPTKAAQTGPGPLNGVSCLLRHCLQVLCCLALLVNVLGVESAATYPLLLPLLREALHPDSTQPELLEDGLGLWLVAVRNAPSSEAGSPLLELTPALTACLTNSTGG